MANVCSDPTSDPGGTTLPPRRRRREDEGEPVLQSDFSADLQITADELDAIGRLLGEDLKTFLSES